MAATTSREWSRRTLVLIVPLLVLAGVTLLSFSGTKTNDLGYSSMCPFAPWSTLALLVPVALLLAIRAYLRTRKD